MVLVGGFIGQLSRQAVDPALEVEEDALADLSALLAIESGIERTLRILELAPKRHEPMSVARFGLLAM